MTSEEAHKIVAACIKAKYEQMGIPATFESGDLEKYSLRELLDANHMVEAENREPPKKFPHDIHMMCDDRLVAALYVACHYPAVNPGRGIEPIAVVDRRGVIVVTMPDEAEGG